MLNTWSSVILIWRIQVRANLRSGPIFSGSHTFFLTATANIAIFTTLPAGMLLQSETKFEPDLRLSTRNQSN